MLFVILSQCWKPKTTHIVPSQYSSSISCIRLSFGPVPALLTMLFRHCQSCLTSAIRPPRIEEERKNIHIQPPTLPHRYTHALLHSPRVTYVRLHEFGPSSTVDSTDQVVRRLDPFVGDFGACSRLQIGADDKSSALRRVCDCNGPTEPGRSPGHDGDFFY